MNATVAALAAASGVHLVHSSFVAGRCRQAPIRSKFEALLGRGRARFAAATSGEVNGATFTGVTMALFGAGTAMGVVLFASVLPALTIGACSASVPATSLRMRAQRRRAVAHEAWPAMIEQIRILTGSVGRSIPQALFEVGRRAPHELRPSFDAAHREWVLSTDFTAALSVLKHWLADPTADATCETLLVAYEVGGADLGRRLESLAQDRLDDVQSRKDARAKQAGVRFARRFVLLVPLGMALAGMSVGTGRDAYRTPLGQVLVLAGIAVIAACWVWAGLLLRLPLERRVLTT